MKKILIKIKDAFITASIEKTIAFALIIVGGVSFFSLYNSIKALLKTKITLTIGSILIILAGIILSFYVTIIVLRRLKNKQQFEEGTRIVLSTRTSLVMSAGKYNFWNNKVLCTWIDGKEVKENWINQNQLTEYEPPTYNPRPRPKKFEGYWR